MSRNRRRHILASAFLPVVAAMYADGGDAGGGAGGTAGGTGGGAAGDKGDKGAGDKGAKKIELTAEELEQRTKAAIDDALKKERDDADKKKKQADEDAARKKAEEQGEFQKIADDEQKKRVAAETRAAEADRRAQVAEVNIQLRDHLAGDDTRRAFIANAPDIMLHVEKKLTADAKPEDVKKLIETETAAFIERTGAAKGAAGGAPPAGSRGKLPPGTKVPPGDGSNGSGAQPRYARPASRL